MGCFVVTEFLLTTASCGPSAIAEPLVHFTFIKVIARNLVVGWELSQPIPPFLSIPLPLFYVCNATLCRPTYFPFKIQTKDFEGNL